MAAATQLDPSGYSGHDPAKVAKAKMMREAADSKRALYGHGHGNSHLR